MPDALQMLNQTLANLKFKDDSASKKKAAELEVRLAEISALKAKREQLVTVREQLTFYHEWLAGVPDHAELPLTRDVPM